MKRPTLPSATTMFPPLLTILLLAAGNALAAPPAPAPNGAALYSSDCASCHGSAGKGDGPAAKALAAKPPDLTKSRANQQRIESIVRDGLQHCPSWKASMSEGEIAAVAAYAKSLQK